MHSWTTASPRKSGRARPRSTRSWAPSRPSLSMACACASVPCAATADRKSTRLNSSHTVISYAVFCLKKKKKLHTIDVLHLSGINYDTVDKYHHNLWCSGQTDEY